MPSLQAACCVFVGVGFGDAVGRAVAVGFGVAVGFVVGAGVAVGFAVAVGCGVGPTAVCVARPYLYGLAAFGQRGVERVMELLKTELALNMGLAGVPNLKAIDRSLVRWRWEHKG